jgi:CBS domain-containing protein
MEHLIPLLQRTPPFSLLPESVLQEVSESMQKRTFHKETLAYHQEVTEMQGVDVIMEGEYQTFFFDASQNKRCVEIHHSPYCFGGISVVLNRVRALKSVTVKKGTVVYTLPKKEFTELCNAYEDFFHYFTSDFGKKMLDEEFAHFVKTPASFEESYFAADQLYSRKIESIAFKDIVSCTENTPIFEAARIMAKNKVSCLFIRRGNDQKITGYVTDITLRDNVIAQCIDPQKAVSGVMDNPIISISSEAYLYEAVLMMFKTKTRYLLVEKDGEMAGFLSRNRLLSEQAQSPLVFIQSVKQAATPAELRKKWLQVPDMINQLLGRGVHGEIASQIITTIADTITVKVIENVIRQIGKPPAKFVFMVTGSEGRKEQTLSTDQDNGIIYEDKANEHREMVRDYFLDFAKRVSDDLNTIGFVYCKGEFMASNPKWTHSLSHWKRNYEEWINETVPENAMKFSTLFDCRYIYGEESIINELKGFIQDQLRNPNERFFTFIAKNALQYEAPLTFFKRIKTQTIGKAEVFDIKTAMSPIVDLLRVYALKNGINNENTGERMKELLHAGVFTKEQYQELHHSYYYLMALRLKNQVHQINIEKKMPDNYIEISRLTKIERVTLTEIFKTISNFQQGIRMKFTGSLS